LQIEWNPKKREANLRKHGLDLVDAVPIFEGPMLALPDTRQDYGEDRWIGVGITNGSGGGGCFRGMRRGMHSHYLPEKGKPA